MSNRIRVLLVLTPFSALVVDAVQDDLYLDESHLHHHRATVPPQLVSLPACLRWVLRLLLLLEPMSNCCFFL